MYKEYHIYKQMYIKSSTQKYVKRHSYTVLVLVLFLWNSRNSDKDDHQNMYYRTVFNCEKSHLTKNILLSNF